MGNTCAKKEPIVVDTLEDISVRKGLKVEDRKFQFGTVRVVKKINGEVVGWISNDDNFIKADNAG